MKKKNIDRKNTIKKYGVKRDELDIYKLPVGNNYFFHTKITMIIVNNLLIMVVMVTDESQGG